ncbi:hypothetical protein Vadar_022246 [Vaccinium darrowii]|uniref:Uncharacterized protein n=1 Tax=Vaccinium darrowii TaxID=229202 RepID=A0ACB7XSM0_9ERIC|nr:hypothetical protein Vadar_022246 [Vaccinium darrowii]
MTLIATLISTVTFAAPFTMPGGFDGTDVDNLGVAILVKKASLKVFILADSIAMCCSMAVMFLLLWAMITEKDEDENELAIIGSQVLQFALLATLVAFVSGIFAVIAPKALWDLWEIVEYGFKDPTLKGEKEEAAKIKDMILSIFDLDNILNYETSSLITLERLDGTNYVEWSLNVQSKIRGRKRWGYISAKDIWEAVKNTYSVDQDASKAYQLHCEVIPVRQNGGSIISYFGKLQKIWQELDDIDDCFMECANDIVIYTTKVNSERVYKFLAGLDPHLDRVRGRVLSTKPLPGIQAAYAMVCAKANHQDAMLGGNIGEGAVMASRKMPISKKDRKCTHCNGTGHTVNTCFRLHGYPEWHPKSKKASHKEEGFNPKANLATTLAFTAKSGDFSDEREELSVVEPETSHTEDNAPHDSTMPPNNSIQPLSQSSSEIPPEQWSSGLASGGNTSDFQKEHVRFFPSQNPDKGKHQCSITWVSNADKGDVLRDERETKSERQRKDFQMARMRAKMAREDTDQPLATKCRSC